jgi:colanic acid/amylovoran biosynthesis glycosyltransferase
MAEGKPRRSNWKQMESVTLCVYDRAGACGGPFGWAVDFSRFLHRSGFPVQVLILCPGGRPNSLIAEACEVGGIPLAILDTGKAGFLEDQTEWILREWAQRPSSVFIANLVLPALFAARWIRRAGGKTVGVIHSNPDHDPFYSDVLNQFVAGGPEWHLDVIVPVSDYIANKVADVASPGLLISTIPCGTSLPDARAVPPVSGLRLLYCGRLVREAKRIRELTESLLEACKLEGVSATLCGDGEERAWLEERLAGQNKVRYAGHIPPDRMPALMAEHHVLVLLSDYEGLSMALVEGMACGLVPVCLDEPSGTREVIEHGRNGFIVKNREGDFIRRVRELRCPNLWKAFSLEARKTVLERYAHSVTFRRWSELIRNLTGIAVVPRGALPSRVRLRHHRLAVAFGGYEFCRPGGLEVFAEKTRQLWSRFKRTARPRSRWRAFKRQVLNRCKY